MTGYSEKILQYAVATTHIGILENADGTGEVGLSSEDVGKRLAVRFTLKLAGNKVATTRFQVFGCGFTIAACAAAAELAEGQSLDEIGRYTPATIDQALAGLPAERSYCAELANAALQAAVNSARNGAGSVQRALPPATEEDHQPRISADDAVYQRLLASKAPPGSAREDRHLFACLLAVASQEACPLSTALGLDTESIDRMLAEFFPAITRETLDRTPQPPAQLVPEGHPQLLKILLAHLPCEATDARQRSAVWLAHSIAARVAQPGHLWVAMGFFARPELTAAIRRHLPTLAAANQQGMRWKRYLFKQLCDLNGGTLCKAPNCGVCSDYALCFAPDA